MSDSGFSIEGAQKELDEFTKSIAGVVPNPSHYRVLELNKTYSLEEIKLELQKFSSYLTYLYAMIGKMDAEHIILSRGLKKGLAVARLDPNLKSSGVGDREAEILAASPEFAKYTKEEILSDAYLQILKGWAKAYEAAYTGASRMLSADEAESAAISSRVS